MLTTVSYCLFGGTSIVMQIKLFGLVAEIVVKCWWTVMTLAMDGDKERRSRQRVRRSERVV